MKRSFKKKIQMDHIWPSQQAVKAQRARQSIFFLGEQGRVGSVNIWEPLVLFLFYLFTPWMEHEKKRIRGSHQTVGCDRTVPLLDLYPYGYGSIQHPCPHVRKHNVELWIDFRFVVRLIVRSASRRTLSIWRPIVAWLPSQSLRTRHCLDVDHDKKIVMM